MPISSGNKAIAVSYTISSSAVGRKKLNISTQTVRVENRTSNTPEVREKSTQTRTTTKNSIVDTKHTSCELFSLLTYSKNLLSFLSNASKAILTEMNDSGESYAFEEHDWLESEIPKDINKLGHVCSLHWEKSTYHKEKLMKERTESFFENEVNALHNVNNIGQYGLDITGMDWDSSSSLLGTSFGEENNVGWCRKTGAIVVWNVNMQQLNSNAPVYVAEHDSPLTCIASHPSKARIFASASKSGEVLVYDFNQREPLIAISKTNHYFHTLKVSSVQWCYDNIDMDWHLCSMGTDGKLLIWKLSSKLKYPFQGFMLKSESKKTNERLTFGCTTMVFMKDKKSQRTVMIGCDCGAIIQATLPMRVQAKGSRCKLSMNWSTDALKMLDGVPLPHQRKLASIVEKGAKLKMRSRIDYGDFYACKPPLDVLYPSVLEFVCRPHNERITSLQISKFDPTIYFSCGLDGKLYLFSVENNSLISEIDPLQSLPDIKAYSVRDARFVESKVIAIGDESGKTCIYDLRQSLQTPVATIPQRQSGGSGISDLAFSETNEKLLAVAESTGIINVWQLPHY